MIRCTRVVFPVLLFFICPVLRANVSVSASLSLTNLQIIPASGTLQILSGFGASAFTSVYDSLGGAAQQFSSATDAATSANSATAFAFAAGAASATGLTASASSGLSLSGVNAAAGTNAGAPYGALYGFFEITDPSGNPGVTNPVNVTFNAWLSMSQNLATDSFGSQATSEVLFSLLLPDISGTPFLFMDNPVVIGPGGSLSVSSTPMLTGTADLMTNTDYYLYAETDAESFGNNVPEPSYRALTGFSVFILIVISVRRGSRRHLNATRSDAVRA